MKKLSLSVFILSVSNLVCAQHLESQVSSLRLDRPEEQPRPTTQITNGNRAVGDTVWIDSFDVPANWTATGPSGNYTTNGWSIGTQCHGWYFNGTGDMGTSGNFARFTNDDPTANPTTHVQNGPFTLEYNTPIDLTGIVSPQLQFEQYGARFITLQSVEVSIDGGIMWTEVINNNDITPLTAGGGDLYPKPMTRTAYLGPYITGNPANVTIRLLWDGALNGPTMNYAEYGWFVDNVRIIEGGNYDADIQSAYFRSGVGGIYPEGLEYYSVPESQVTPITFSAEVFNAGGQTHTGLALESNVDYGGNVFSDVSATVDLPSYTYDSLGASSTFTPSGSNGTYTMSWNFAGTNAEDVTSNDTITDSFEITTSTYSRAKPDYVSSIANVASNTGNPFEIGNVMEIFGSSFVNGVSIRISDNPSNVGQIMYCTFHIYDSGTGDFLWANQTLDYTIQNGDLGTYVDLVFTSPNLVDPGDIILLCAGHYGGANEVEFGMSQNTVQNSVLGYASFTLFALSNPKAIMLNADMVDYYYQQQSVDICSGDSVQVGSNYYSSPGIYYDTLAAVNGMDSIIESSIGIIQPYEDTVYATICDGDTYTVGSSSYMNPGTYTDVLSGAVCDSTIHTVLTVAAVPDASVINNGDTITAVTSGATYQWVDCDNGMAAIPGETGQQFIATLNGNYAVEVTVNGCTNTSACTSIQGIGITESTLDNINIYPNPTSGEFVVTIANNDWVDNQIYVTNSLGQFIMPPTPVSGKQMVIGGLDLVPGVYFVTISNAHNNRTIKVLVK
ncbi:MAG: T9SS type A sorting domain-containing protein [Crocinitomicaceae bacterium]|nr:T9SS type A sorting domain-containing protein [Crocinitomicaceae bacterium]